MAASVAFHPKAHSSASAERVDDACLKPAIPDFQLNWLKLRDFRNYDTLSIDEMAGQMVLIGPNGAGKTNILEAISLLAPGRGLRRAARADLVRAEKENASSAHSPGHSAGRQWAVAAEIVTPDGPVQMGTGSVEDDMRRAVRVNGAPAAQSDLGQICAISWLTPQMDGLFLDGPSSRRRFLDRLAISFDPAHAGRLTRYDKAFRERSKLLQERPGEESWLASLEAGLAETGVAIMATRAALIADMNHVLKTEETGFPRAHIELKGGGCEALEARPALEVEDSLRLAAKENRQQGQTSMPGPHASDMLVWHADNQQQAHLCSTGEQKALLIALILVHASLQGHRLGRPPILLLDDVAAHLDATRRQLLFARCSQLKGQVWYSGTDHNMFTKTAQETQFIDLQQGQIC